VSPSQGPPNGCTPGIGGGSTEVFAVYEGAPSGNALANSKAFDHGFLKDVSVVYGVDGDVENTTFTSNQTVLKGGPRFASDVRGSRS